ncbi:MAG: hypothetical protein IH946_01850 [Bacteroidetes bacterium]|nr:hypothetical protein [Bacteroidota bacterium]
MGKSKQSITENIIGHLHEMQQGRCSITSQIIKSESNKEIKLILTNLYQLFNDPQSLNEEAVHHQESIKDQDKDALQTINKLKRTQLASLNLMEDMRTQKEELVKTKAQLLSKTDKLKAREAELKTQQQQLRQSHKELEEKSILLEEKNSTIVAKNKELEITHIKLEQQTKDLVINTKKIQDLNENLEQKVQERTAEHEKVFKKMKITHLKLVQSEKMAAIGYLTAGVTHELNNPINLVNVGVMGLVKDLKDLLEIIKKYEALEKLHGINPSIQKIKEKLDYNLLKVSIPQAMTDIMTGVKRSVDIIGGLQNFNRLDKDDMELGNLHEGLDGTLRLLQFKMNNRIKIIKEYDKNIKPLMGHHNQLNQVFMNLLVNAEEAIINKGEIRIVTKKLNGQVELRVIDNGVGMSKDVAKNVFDPFYTTKEVGKGTGLGLSISYGIIESHGGSMKVKSKRGKGSEFIIRIPTE